MRIFIFVYLLLLVSYPVPTPTEGNSFVMEGSTVRMHNITNMVMRKAMTMSETMQATAINTVNPSIINNGYIQKQFYFYCIRFWFLVDQLLISRPIGN